MLLLLQKILGFVVLLGGLVAVHELGHFLVAKLVGVKVLKFSIGFGPKLLGFKYGETEYVLAWFPLGGFVRMAGELPTDKTTPEEESQSFLAQPWWKRASIALAGPAFNIVFPLGVFFAVYWGSTEEMFLPRIGSLTPELPAAQAGLLPGDVLTKIDGVPIQWFSDIPLALKDRWERDVVVEYTRDGTTHSTTLRPKKHEEVTLVRKKTYGLLGLSLHARPAILGVLPDSAAKVAGLQTFDRILEVNGEPIRDEIDLLKALKAASSSLQLRVVRAQYEDVAGWKLRVPEVVSLSMPKQEGEGYAAMGAMPGDLFVGEILKGTPAEKAGLKRGDLLLAWDGEPIYSWAAVGQKLSGREGQPFQLSWLGSDNNRHEVELAQELQEKQVQHKLRLPIWELGLRPQLAYVSAEDVLGGISKPEPHPIRIGFWKAWKKSLEVVPELTVDTTVALMKMVTGQASGENVGGPVMIFQVAAQSAEQGLGSYLSMMAMLSINLALVNLLPLPILDGFTVLTALWEGIRRKPLPMRFREIANLVGLVLLVLLMGYALKNDIVRILR
ncbi:MAG: RIP metalloprotease RseP [Proteobacteria bacterium]|nr:RIP metalloprotease RseP [Cystobacterineae bacterium]MCL2258264.1 RIP metalloprotease RseP [Cystobacterineae bacterium]MCL2315425.1 RIP metalloprotease RseP [Pseudomonadota bacterium]